MEIKRILLKHNQKVWACAYATNNTEKSMALKKKPVFGIVDLNRNVFYELNKNGSIKKSSMVSIGARHYANTKEECVQVYNNLIQNQINFLFELIDKCKSDLEQI